MQEEIYNMLDNYIIESSDTVYNNPLVLIRKSTGALRIVLNARNLNKHIETERDRPVSTDDLLTRFENAKYFS